VSYDMGVEPSYPVHFLAMDDGNFESVVDTNYSNPDEWANPEGYSSIENSKGTTILDRNFVQVFPGIRPQENLNKVKVVPNPYIVRSNFKESEFLRRIRFTNLPNVCKIKIFTLSGEFVNELDHNSDTEGNEWWDLRSINNQEVSPGLYLYYIEQLNPATHKKIADQVGKFAIVR
jgi:hypothetical protein